MKRLIIICEILVVALVVIKLSAAGGVLQNMLPRASSVLELDHAMANVAQKAPENAPAKDPAEDGLANWLRTKLPAMTAYGITRWKNVLMQLLFFNLARKRPEKTKERLLDLVRDHLGPDYDIATHFTPKYNPWDQRLCLVPDADLFDSIKAGQSSVVTDEIATFTETGIELKSGEHLEADIIVTATGFNLNVMGDIGFAGFVSMLIFLGVLTVGFVYEWKKGALEWD